MAFQFSEELPEGEHVWAYDFFLTGGHLNDSRKVMVKLLTIIVKFVCDYQIDKVSINFNCDCMIFVFVCACII